MEHTSYIPPGAIYMEISPNLFAKSHANQAERGITWVLHGDSDLLYITHVFEPPLIEYASYIPHTLSHLEYNIYGIAVLPTCVQIYHFSLVRYFRLPTSVNRNYKLQWYAIWNRYGKSTKWKEWISPMMIRHYFHTPCVICVLFCTILNDIYVI